MFRLVSNPPNPYRGVHAEWLDVPPPAKLEVYEERAKSIISENDSPDIGFSFSINPYRGCFHACAYCYARPTHQYIEFGAGTDFERKIVVKINAPELLRKEFEKKKWQGETIVFSGVTDCYQPLEASYEITKQCLEVCAEYRNPVSIITKGALIRRDLELLLKLKRDASVSVYMSIAFADDKMSKLIEPSAPRPSVRFRALKELADAGIRVSVGVAPIIPALNDVQIPEIIERAAEAGAQGAFMTLLHLPAEAKDVFIERLNEAFPERSQKVLNQLQGMRDGQFNRSPSGNRMRGEGPEWEAIEFIFKSACKKHGLNKDRSERTERPPTFRRPVAQLDLF